MTITTMLTSGRLRFDAVLLDLDRTLVDSLPDLLDALNATLQVEGLRSVTATEIRSMFGDGALVLLTRVVPATGGNPARVADLVPALLAIYEPNASRRTRTFPDVTRTLAHLVEAGFGVAVVTNKPVRAAGLILDALNLSRFISSVVGGDTLGRLKPDQAPLQEAMRRLGAVPDHVGADHLIHSFGELPAVMHAAVSSENWSSRVS